jgi:hypothetical protein
VANIQIPNLPAAIALSGPELLETVQSGSSLRVTVNQIAAFAYSGGFGPVSEWQPDTFYSESQIVFNGLILYRSLNNHTSAATFAADSANWAVVIDLTPFVDDEIEEFAPIAVATKAFEDRDAAIAWLTTNTSPEGMVLEWGGVSVRYVDALTTTIPDMPGYVPNGRIYNVQFGAKEDWNGVTGTDDLAAIDLALAYGAVVGEWVWSTGPSVVSGPVRIPENCPGMRGTKPVDSSLNQTGAPVWPSGYRMGSGLISSSTSAPVIHIRYPDQWLLNLEFGSTEARYNASPSTGYGNVNCGILIEPLDTSGGQITRSGAIGCLVRNQPTDGWIAAGQIVSINMVCVSEINCRRHGHVVDNGAITGRTNKARPGIIGISFDRQINVGGHLWKYGNESEGEDQPYRMTLIQSEGFRCGNEPAYLTVDSASYALGEQLTFINCATSCSSGYSGNIPTLDHPWAIGGKTNTFIDCRAISYVAEPVLLLESPWEGTGSETSTVLIQGMHCANGSAPDPVNFLEHGGHPYYIEITMVSGNFSGYPIDLVGFTGTACINYGGKFNYINMTVAAKDFLADAGTTSRPSYSFTADDNTGIYNPAANELAVVTGTSISANFKIGQTGINTASPDASAALDVVSTTRGFLPPRVTTTQRNAISTPADGLLVYDTTLDQLITFANGVWDTLNKTDAEITTAVGDGIGADPTAQGQIADAIVDDLPFLQSGTNTVSRAFVAKFYNTRSIKDYGATGTSDPADAAKFANFISDLNTLGGVGLLELGNYIVNAGDIDLTRDGVSLIGQGAGNCANLFPSASAPTTITVQGTTGRGIRVRGQGVTLANFRLTSDTSRAAALFNIDSAGIHVEPNDTASARADRCVMSRLRIDKQPGDGIAGVGNTIYMHLIDSDIYQCKGFGIRGEAGTAGIIRTNPHYPGLWKIDNSRIGYCGGHSIALSRLNVTTQNEMAIRCTINNVDSFGNGSDTSIMYQAPDGNYYDFNIFGENCTVINSAPCGLVGPTLTPESMGGLLMGGRDNSAVNNRYNSTNQPIYYFYNSSQPSTGFTVNGMRIINTTLTHTDCILVEDASAKGLRVFYDRVESFTNVVNLRIGAVPTDALVFFQGVAHHIAETSGFGPEIIDDDEVLIIPVVGTSASITAGAVLSLAPTSAGSGGGIFHMRFASSSPLATKWAGEATTVAYPGGGPLTGTTGVDGELTVSADNTNIYIENRRGFQLSVSYSLAATPRYCYI